MAISRKDPKGRKLREGENWRNDGRYSYRYTDVRTGKRLTVYAQDLPELREKEYLKWHQFIITLNCVDLLKLK